jgi:hypothetical protein
MKPKLILPSNGRAHGWRPDTPNVNAPRLSERISTRTRATAIENPMIDPALYPKIRDQDWLGSCTGFAMRSTALLKFYEKHGDKIGTGKYAKLYDFSPLAAYWLGRRRENSINEDSGCEIQDVVGEAAKFGIPTEEAWPYQIPQYKKQPPVRAFTEGLWHQAIGSYRCDEKGKSREATVDNMLRALKAGLPIHYGFTCYDNLNLADDTGLVPLPTPSSVIEGGHAVACFWADTAARIFWGPNSWGNRWGAKAPAGARYSERGYIGIPFQAVLDGWCDDCWAIDIE